MPILIGTSFSNCGRNVSYNYFKRRFFIFGTFQNTGQPFGLFGTVEVILGNTGIFNIRIRLIFSRIQNNTIDRTLSKGIIKMFLTGRKITLDFGCKYSPCFVVATGVVHRDLRSEKSYSRIHKPLEKLIFTIYEREHITIKKNKVGLRKVTTGH